MTSPLSVSVLIAVRNGAAHLAEAIASIERAGRIPLEILVIDGHSTDATTAIAARHPLARILPQAGAGIADAYNEGVAACRGEAIAFLSHDDLWTEGKLAIQLARLEADPSLMLCFGHVQHRLAGGLPPGFRRELLDWPVPGFIMETMVARREVFARVGPFDTSFSTAEDVDWIARTRDAHIPTELVPDTVLIKRIHASNASMVDRGGKEALFKALRHTITRRHADQPSR